jgi:hypothetical protein
MNGVAMWYWLLLALAIKQYHFSPCNGLKVGTLPANHSHFDNIGSDEIK